MDSGAKQQKKILARREKRVRKQAHHLLERRDYLRVNAARRRWITEGFILQAKPAAPQKNARISASDTGLTVTPQEHLPLPSWRIGITVSKKVGGAVVRNRLKRRLREISRLLLPHSGLSGWDYVLVGRFTHTEIPFEKLKKDLVWALGKLHTGVDLKSPDHESYQKKPKLRRKKKQQKNLAPLSAEKTAPKPAGGTE